MSDAARNRLWRLALPIMLSNVSAPLLGVVDTAVVGHLPRVAALGAVGAGALAFSFLYWGLGFLRMSTTALVAQSLGRGDGEGLRAWIGRGMLLALLLSAGVLASHPLIGRGALDLLAPDAQVRPLAERYFAWRIWGVPAHLVQMVQLGALLGLQQARAALVMQLWVNAFNAALDVVLVVGLGFGVEGVALATVLAQWTGVWLGVYLVRRVGRGLAGRWRPRSWFHAPALRHLVSVNRDFLIRTLCLIAAFASFTSTSARLGAVTLAANTLLLNFQHVAAYALDGFAHAAETLVGETFGRGDAHGLRRVVRTSTYAAAVLAAVLSAAYFAVGGVVVDLLTDLADVRREARAFLPWVAALPLLSVWGFQLDGVFVGATRGRDMRNAMLLSLGVYLVSLWASLPRLGAHGLWLAFCAFMLARGITLAGYYPRLVWALGRPAGGASTSGSAS